MENPIIIKADLAEILYEGKNKSYGGYMLRRNQDRNLMTGFLFAAAGIFVLCLWLGSHKGAVSRTTGAIVASLIEPVTVELTTEKTETHVTHPAHTDTRPSDPAPAGGGTPPPATTTDGILPVADNHASDNSTLRTADSAAAHPDAVAGIRGEGTGTGPGTGTGTGTGTGSEDNGNAGALEGTAIDGQVPFALNMDKIRKEIRFPEPLQQVGINKGKVVFRVLVNEKGDVEQLEVREATHPLFVEACRTAIMKVKFSPGTHRGRPVKVWTLQPIMFRTLN